MPDLKELGFSRITELKIKTSGHKIKIFSSYGQNDVKVAPELELKEFRDRGIYVI